MHFYEAAKNINKLINPYFNIQTNKMAPERSPNKEEDLKLVKICGKLLAMNLHMYLKLSFRKKDKIIDF